MGVSVDVARGRGRGAGIASGAGARREAVAVARVCAWDVGDLAVDAVVCSLAKDLVVVAIACQSGRGRGEDEGRDDSEGLELHC